MPSSPVPEVRVITRDRTSLLRCFRQSGYVTVGPVLSSRELRALRAAYNRILAEEGVSVQSRPGAPPGPGADFPVQVLDVHRRSDTFRRLLYKESLLDLVEAFLGGRGVCLYRDQALYKPARHGGAVRWHQDDLYWNLDPPTAVSCWIPLDDATPENGCLWVVPGSHRAGKAECRLVDGRLEAAADESLAVPVPVPAGHALFHHCHTLHMSKANCSPRIRRAWVIHYMVKGTRGDDEFLSDPLVLRP